MQISKWFILFLLYSCMGWIYESTFRTIKDRQWVNRGFLYGPVCPIYGVGAVTVSLLWHGLNGIGAAAPWWQLLLVSILGSAVLEYATSWGLEKLFHAVWWDYSNLPLNIHGRVSLFTSIGFGLAGLLIVYVLAPRVETLADLLPSPAAELLALVLMAVLASDLTLTVSALSNFRRVVKQLDDSFNSRMDLLVENVQEKSREAKSMVLLEQENAARALRSMGGAYRGALRRVRSFRYPGKSRERIEYLLRGLREHVSKKTK